jgi:sugar phosphate isomerase/epimerase
MMIGISNIGWSAADDPRILPRLRRLGVAGLDVVPARTWPPHASVDDMRAVRAALGEYGLSIVAFQSLLFQHPGLDVFGAAPIRTETLRHLSTVCDAAAQVGARILVFGSAANRRRGRRSVEEADQIAAAFFAEIGAHAAHRGVAVCIEPLPPEVGCDYVHTAEDALRLIRAVGSPGFGLHLDAAALHASGEDIETAIASSIDVLRHFHISEPGLTRIGTAGVDHCRIATALHAAGYAGVASIEMLPRPSATVVEDVEASIAYAQAVYA